MLQQTQVETVIPYYRRFTRRFSGVRALARTPLDEVMQLWSGLGYYARARNLHRAARLIVERHDGRFPDTVDNLTALPGIGRSTAGAILALAFGQRQPILDGNVKRVLMRYYGMLEPAADAEERLWRLALRNTPTHRVADYTQAIMDLGATTCQRVPDCPACPVARNCVARRRGLTAVIPVRATRRPRPRRAVQMVLLRHQGAVLLEHRPPSGVWGGLWSPPECPERDSVTDFMARRYGLAVAAEVPWPVLERSFTHFDLCITPVPARLLGPTHAVADSGTVWYKLDHPEARGLAAPVKHLLQRLRDCP